MKNILFIVNNGKISPNVNGGAAVYYSHLELLYKSGFNITVLCVQWGETDTFNDVDFFEIKDMVKKIVSYKIFQKTPTNGTDRLFNAFFRPHIFEYYFLNKKNQKYLKIITKEHSIDLVWAEWRWAGLWAGFSNLSIPVIYAHHDWEFKLAKLRKKGNLLQKFHTFQKKRVEYKLVKSVSACISGSNTEALEIEKLSNKKALYIPTTYKDMIVQLQVNDKPNIIHLGGMGTTANRLGLERFLDVCWDSIKKENPTIKLIIIGGLSEAPASLLKKLKDTNIECLGFVKELSDVLHPQDIHIIPWEFNTGTRTRLPLIFNYEQVLVGTKASVEAFPEVWDKENSLLCDTLEEMTSKINLILSDKSARQRISKKGKETFLKSFTVENRVQELKKYLENLE